MARRLMPLARTLARSYSQRTGGAPRGRHPPGAVARVRQPQQEEWVEVLDEGSGRTYWWCKRTNETTPLGAPKPGPEGITPYLQQNHQMQMRGLGPRNFRGMLMESFAWGVGITVALIAVRILLWGVGMEGESESRSLTDEERAYFERHLVRAQRTRSPDLVT